VTGGTLASPSSESWVAGLHVCPEGLRTRKGWTCVPVGAVLAYPSGRAGLCFTCVPAGRAVLYLRTRGAGCAILAYPRGGLCYTCVPAGRAVLYLRTRGGGLDLRTRRGCTCVPVGFVASEGFRVTGGTLAGPSSKSWVAGLHVCSEGFRVTGGTLAGPSSESWVPGSHVCSAQRASG